MSLTQFPCSSLPVNRATNNCHCVIPNSSHAQHLVNFLTNLTFTHLYQVVISKWTVVQSWWASEMVGWLLSAFGSHILKASLIECWTICSTSWSTSWSTLDGHLNQYSADTQSILSKCLDQHLIDSGLSVDWLIYFDRHSMACLQKLVESQPRCWWSVDLPLINISINTSWISRLILGKYLDQHLIDS